MRKLLTFAMIFCMMFSFCAAAFAEEIPTAEPVALDEHPEIAFITNISRHDGCSVEGVTFDGDVVITGENGMIRFTNCTFNGNLINKGGEGARIFVWADCSFAEGGKCVIDSSLEDATMDTDLPKLMLFCSVPEILCTTAGAVVTTADQVIRLNGVEYPMDAAEYFVNETTGEFAPYTGQEAGMHNYAMWTENGESIQMHIAVSGEE